MNSTALLSIAAVMSVLGIVALFFLKPDVSPQYLQMSGEITRVDVREKVTFITFIPDDFLVVSFEEQVGPGKVVLTGRLQQYKGRVEFVVSSAERVEE